MVPEITAEDVKLVDDLVGDMLIGSMSPERCFF
jgi:hypothetical protein